MKGAGRLVSRFGANMAESMGAEGAESGALASMFHGGTAGRETGLQRPKTAFVIPIDRLSPDPDQPRKAFDAVEISALANSLQRRGQLQPIRVRWDAEAGIWRIVLGERRYRAALEAQLPSLLAIEETGSPSPEDRLEDQLVENALREDLRPTELADAYRTLMVRRGLTYRQLSERLHISLGKISRTLALLELPAEIQADVDAGLLATSVAADIVRIEDPIEQAAAAREIVEQGLNRDEAKRRIGRRTDKPVAEKRDIRTPSGLVTVRSVDGGAGLEGILAALTSAASTIRAEIRRQARDAAA